MLCIFVVCEAANDTHNFVGLWNAAAFTNAPDNQDFVTLHAERGTETSKPWQCASRSIHCSRCSKREIGKDTVPYVQSPTPQPLTDNTILPHTTKQQSVIVPKSHEDGSKSWYGAPSCPQHTPAFCGLPKQDIICNITVICLATITQCARCVVRQRNSARAMSISRLWKIVYPPPGVTCLQPAVFEDLGGRGASTY